MNDIPLKLIGKADGGSLKLFLTGPDEDAQWVAYVTIWTSVSCSEIGFQ